MILYVNGDSHSAGYGCGIKFSYGQLLSNELKMDFVCDAVPGCSNISIINRTENYLKNNTPDLIIIGWSTWERETWYHNNKAYHITASGTDIVPDELKEKYKKWVIESTTEEAAQKCQEVAHEQIWKLHCKLKEQNIKHLFFNTYLYFNYIVDFNKSKYDWGHNYISPYDPKFIYYYYLKDMGYLTSPLNSYHYDYRGHQEWANFLLPYIKQL